MMANFDAAEDSYDSDACSDVIPILHDFTSSHTILVTDSPVEKSCDDSVDKEDSIQPPTADERSKDIQGPTGDGKEGCRTEKVWDDSISGGELMKTSIENEDECRSNDKESVSCDFDSSSQSSDDDEVLSGDDDEVKDPNYDFRQSDTSEESEDNSDIDRTKNKRYSCIVGNINDNGDWHERRIDKNRGGDGMIHTSIQDKSDKVSPGATGNEKEGCTVNYRGDSVGGGDSMQTHTGDKGGKDCQGPTGDGKNGCTVSKYSGKYWDKQHCCVFCNKLYAKLPRHFQQKHKDEPDVARALSMPVKSKGRDMIWTELRQKGDFSHNKEVLRGGGGEIIAKQRPRKEADASVYVPCPDCLGMFRARALWRHKKKCKFQSGNNKKRGSSQRDAKLLLPVPVDVHKKFHRDILATMKTDACQLVATTDQLILRFGQKLYSKHAARQHQHQYVKQKMRELARFVLTFRQLDPNVNSLSQMIDPEKYRTCVKAVQKLSGFDEDTGKCKVPSVALKVGHSLKKCGKIMKSEATEKGDDTSRKQAKLFVCMCEDNWECDVSTFALETLEANRYNNPKRIPLTKDIQKLHKHLEEKAQVLHEELLSADSQKSEPVWRYLSEVTLAQIVLFNRRRGGEAERIMVQQVEQGLMSGTNLQEEIMLELSPFEQKLAKSLERIEIRGKRGRRVPVLLTQKYKERVQCLLSKRPPQMEKTFLFLRGSEARTTLSTSEILRKFAKESGTEKPELLTSTALRKHIATMSQVLNLKDHELDVLADFLGHDIRVHRQYYRLSEDTMQLAKVSKLLFQLESGNIAQHKGKTLDEIQIDEDEEIEVEADIGFENTGHQNKETDAFIDTAAIPDDGMKQPLQCEKKRVHERCADAEDEDVEQPPKKKKCVRQRWSDSEDEIMQQTPRKKKTCAHRKWSDAEKQAMERQFGKFLRNRTLPGKADCESARKKEPALSNRPWAQLKYYIKNNIK